MTLPVQVHTQTSPDAGTGLFASDAIPPAVEILHIRRPLVSVLDSSHLRDTCSECILCLPENGTDREPQSKGLKTCQGCKINKYCCKVGLPAMAHSSKWSVSYCLFEAVAYVISSPQHVYYFFLPHK